MQGLVAFHESAVVEHNDSVKWRVKWFADDRHHLLGKQAESLRAYLDENKETTHVTFKDSQVV